MLVGSCSLTSSIWPKVLEPTLASTLLNSPHEPTSQHILMQAPAPLPLSLLQSEKALLRASLLEDVLLMHAMRE